MAVSKKDFIAIANELKSLATRVRRLPERDPARQMFEETCSALCTGFHRLNWKFSHDIFLGYMNGECGPNGGTIK